MNSSIRLYSTVKGQSLAHLALNGLLPTPLPLVPRVNRFLKTVSVPVINFQRPNEPHGACHTLPWQITQCPDRPDLFYWAVLYYRANLRRGTAAAKNRGRVSGGGRKIYKQKGTGRARAGSSRAPQRKGGGVCFGPRPRDYSQALNRKIRMKALFSALAMKYRHGLFRTVSNGSLESESHKTGSLVPILDQHNSGRILIVDSVGFTRNMTLASRIIGDRVTLFNCETEELPCHAVLNHKLVLMTLRAVGCILKKK